MPPGTLRAGDNTIAVQVTDGGGGGGFSAEPAVLKLETSAGNVPLKDIYNKDVVAESPSISSARNINGRVVVSFADIGGGLVVKPNAANDQRYPYLAEGFTVEDLQGKWHFASGLVGEDDNGVVLVTPPGVTVRKVRYAWASNPERANLFSKEGLPVTPFEVDVK